MEDNRLPESQDDEPRSTSEPPLEGDVPPAEEASLLNVHTLLLAAGGLVAMIVLIGLVSAGLFVLFAQRGKPFAARPPASEEAMPSPQAAPLQVNPGADLNNLRATQQANLSEYAWVDRETGRVRIPIQQAMERIAQGHGLPQASVTLAPGETQTPAQVGEALFQSLGCSGCHTSENTSLAPTLAGLYGEQVSLDNGEVVTAEDAYLRESILDPNARIVAGYQPVMPSFAGRVSEEDLDALIAYIQSLGGG